DGHRLPSGLELRKELVPLGVVAVVYEGRPNVTIDATALCLKSGNAIVLRGSSSASHSNAMLAAIAAEHAPPGAVGLVDGGRDAAGPCRGGAGVPAAGASVAARGRRRATRRRAYARARRRQGERAA